MKQAESEAAPSIPSSGRRRDLPPPGSGVLQISEMAAPALMAGPSRQRRFAATTAKVSGRHEPHHGPCAPAWPDAPGTFSTVPVRRSAYRRLDRPGDDQPACRKRPKLLCPAPEFSHQPDLAPSPAAPRGGAAPSPPLTVPGVPIRRPDKPSAQRYAADRRVRPAAATPFRLAVTPRRHPAESRGMPRQGAPAPRASPCR